MYNKTGRGGRKMILVNTDYITGKEFEMLGLVKGSTIQSKDVYKRQLQQSMYVSTWQSAFERMKLGGTAEE